MEDSSNSEPPLCPCGFWGSAKTLGLCSKCYLEKTKNVNGPDLGGTKDSCKQSKAGRSSKMDSNSKHCPSRSSADNLSKQPPCAEDQKDPNTLPTSCATSSASEDRTPSPGTDAGGSSSRQPVAVPSHGMVEIAASLSEGSNGVGSKKGKEDSVVAAAPASQTVDRPVGSSCELSSPVPHGPAGSAPCGESCANERLSGADGTSDPTAASGPDPKPKCGDKADEAAALLSSQSTSQSGEATTKGTKRSHAEVDQEAEGPPNPVKQKNKKRCFKCSCKLELAQREIGRCRCDRIFCSLHRLPELHGCDFDHKEDGRREAREKMVKPTRHLGNSFRRLDQSS